MEGRSLADEIAHLYEKWPALAETELRQDHRVESRDWLLETIPPGAVGAELGVYTGLFSLSLTRCGKFSKLYLVDFWWKGWGEHFPDWGPYTAGGRLQTQAAFEAVSARIKAAPKGCDVEIVVDDCVEWLKRMPDGSLDWAYLDSSHSYEGTSRELRAMRTKIKPGGLIAGDDWQPDPAHPHHGLFRAVHDAIKSGDFQLVYASPRDYQWILRPC